MTNAFSPDYQPDQKAAAKHEEELKRIRAGKKHSDRRQSKLDSSDPKVRQQAIGDLGPLSGNNTNHKLLKGSKS